MFKSNEELECLIKSGKILATIMNALKEALLNGEKNLFNLDLLAEEYLQKLDARSFKGYHPDFADAPYEFNICASVNNEIVHGRPCQNKILNDGDIVSIDMAVEHNGWYADSAFTIGIGKISDERKLLIEAAESCFEKAYSLCKVGNTIGDLGFAIHKEARKYNFSTAFALTGHGIGESLHEKPDVKNFGLPGHGEIIVPGMSFCIEPMLIAGHEMISESFNGFSDGWTIFSQDGTDSSHYEHTIVITENGPIITTR